MAAHVVRSDREEEGRKKIPFREQSGEIRNADLRAAEGIDVESAMAEKAKEFNDGGGKIYLETEGA